MFTSSPTPARYGTWPRYNPSTSSSSAHPSTPISSLTHQLSLSSTQNNNNNTFDDLSSSPTLSSPVLTTPFAFRHATYAINPLASPVTPVIQSFSSPIITAMGAYPDTPSPPSTYGINGGVIVSESGTMLGSAPGTTATSCIRLVPSQSHVLHHHSQSQNQNDPFVVPSSTSIHTKHPRPALRPTLSHNAVPQLPQHPSNASYRRMMAPLTSTATPSLTPIANAPTPIAIAPSRPSTAGTIVEANTQTIPSFTAPLSTTTPSAPVAIPTSQPHLGHEASIASTTASSFATAPTHPSPAHHQSHSFPPSLNGTPYTDEASFHTTSYSYDTSFSSTHSNSPWSQPPPLVASPHFGHQAPLPPSFYPHPYFDMYNQSVKQLEPILAPGELPAPRPPMSYAALIGEALLIAPLPHHLYVAEISESIKKRYAYYRQNPSKVYNGVRHQTSMCKAFVKLPRPFGDQSGGARKWAIRAGCESWFHGGGYHPPGSNNASAAARKNGGKAKSTARSKQLAIGTGSPTEKKEAIFEDAPWSPGPSAGPAYDGTGRPYYPFPQPPPSYGAAPYYSPGLHYMHIPHGHPHGNYPSQSPQSMNYFGQWGPYQMPPPPALSSSTSTVASSIPASLYPRSFEGDSTSSPEHRWREDTHHQSGPSEHGSHRSYDEKVHSPLSTRAILSPHGTSPEVM